MVEMGFWRTLPLLYFSASSFALEQAPLILPTVDNYGPSMKIARQNGPQIFNALHGSMRQWGSSLKHNGMSYFLASIPAHTALYHGTHTQEPVKGMEWLAFEIEHAENFARARGPGGRRPGPPGGGGPGRGPPGEGSQPIKVAGEQSHESRLHAPPGEDASGYLHTYRTSRELSRLLYLDGMSGGKTSMGTLDSQDVVLRNETHSFDHNSDYDRARDLCDLGVEWGIEGFVRMEAGFELILCNFTNGMDFVAARQRPKYDTPEGYDEVSRFEYMRGVAARYQGISGGRVAIDYSSMVSAFFYPLNLTNPDGSRSELPRLVSSTSEQLARFKLDIGRLSSLDKTHNGIVDWQGVADMIVSRYSDRLQFMASESATQKQIQSEINFLLSNFIDYNTSDISAAKENCATHFLDSAVPKTLSDHLIYAAFLNMSQKMCDTMFEVREGFVHREEKPSFSILEAKAHLQELIEYLDWSTFLECGGCAYDEVCLVAVWPWGSPEDHYSPRCLNQNETADRRGYWGGWEHRPPGV